MPYDLVRPKKPKSSSWLDDLGGALLQVGGGALGGLIGGPVGAAVGSQAGGIAAAAVDPEYGSRSNGIVPAAASLGTYGIGRGLVNAGMKQAADYAKGVTIATGGQYGPEAQDLFDKAPTFVGGVTMDQYGAYSGQELTSAMLKQLRMRQAYRNAYLSMEEGGL